MFLNRFSRIDPSTQITGKLGDVKNIWSGIKQAIGDGEHLQGVSRGAAANLQAAKTVLGQKPNHEAGIGFIDYGSSDDEFDEEAVAADTPGPAATPMAAPTTKRKSTYRRRTNTAKGPREWQKLEK